MVCVAGLFFPQFSEVRRMLPITRKALLSLIAAAFVAVAPSQAQDETGEDEMEETTTEATEDGAGSSEPTATDAPIDAELAKLAQDAATGDYRVRTAAIAKLSGEYGGRAVAALLRWCGSNADIDQRVQAVMSLKRLGSDSAAAMIAGLWSKDAVTRRSLCQALAQVGATSAIPVLACLAEHDADGVVRSEAAKALAALSPGFGGSAAGALLGAAREYLAGAHAPVAGPDGSLRIYFWNGRRVMDREVNAALHNAAYAKSYAEAALQADAANTDAQATLVAAYDAMRNAIRGGGDETGVAGWDGSLGRIEDLLRLGGAVVDVPAIDAPEAESLNGAGDLIGSTDKRMRYLSALTLAATAPTAQVVATLGEALSESAKRQIVVIAPDAAERNAMIAAAGEQHVIAIGADTGATGVIRAKESPVKDAVIIRSTVSDVKADVIIDVLSRDVRSAGVPVILVCDEADRERFAAALGDKVTMIVPAPVNAAILKPAFEAAFEKAALNDERMEAEQFSRRAALALAALDPSLLAPAANALVGATDRADAVRIPALVALSKLGDGAGEGPAFGLMKDTAASAEARVAAVYALRGILARNSGRPETLNALDKMARGSDATLRTAACGALGGASGLTAEARTALFLALSLPY
jgi:AmiR/NasT family two-component response regulator